MNSDVILAAIGIAALAYGAIKLGAFLKSAVESLSQIGETCTFINKNREAFGKSFATYEEIISGANKINQDQVDINLSFVREVVHLREAVETFTGIMNPKDIPVEESTPESVYEGYAKNRQDLIDQGWNQREAEIKAAEWELERIAGGTMTSTLGSGE